MEESPVFAHAVRTIAMARETFDSEEKAADWLRRPTSALGGKAPLVFLDTEEGAQQVEMILTRIGHGIAA